MPSKNRRFISVRREVYERGQEAAIGRGESMPQFAEAALNADPAYRDYVVPGKGGGR